MKSKLYKSILTILSGLLISQPSAMAMVEYVATGTFFGDSLEIEQYDYNTDEISYIDGFLNAPPFPLPSSTFSLRFTVDDSFRGRVPLFSQSSFFDGAVSNVSLDINGSNVFSSSEEVATVGQFPGDFQGLYDASWFYSFFPPFGSINLPSLVAFDGDTFQELGTVIPDGFSFSLYDSTREIYQNTSFLDMLALDFDDFDSTSFQLFWSQDYSEEPPFNDEDVENDIYYTVFGSIDSLSTTSAVPLPAGIWLLLSAISGIAITARRDDSSQIIAS